MGRLEDPVHPDPVAAVPLRRVPGFWIVTLLFALGSAAWFLVVALESGAPGKWTRAYCFVAGLYTAVVGLSLLSRTGRDRLQRSTSKILFLCISSALCLLCLEVAVRWMSPPSPFHPALSMRPSYRRQMQVDLRGVSPRGNFTTNRWGLRGDEPPDHWNECYTIITVGGSTTQCFYLDDRKTWPRLLQDKLTTTNRRLWVGNGGLDGHSTRGHLIMMREAMARIRPDAVVALVGMNDFSLSLKELERRDGNGYDPAPNLELPEDPRDPVAGLLRSASRYSRVLQIAELWKRVLGREVVLVNKSGQGTGDVMPLAQTPPELPAELELVLPQLEEFRANLKEMIAIGRAHGIRMVFLTQPHQFQDDEFHRRQYPRYYWMNTGDDSADGSPPWSAAQHWLLLQEYNRNLMQVCRVEGVECYDLAAAIPHGTTCFYDTVHFNEFGADLVAREVAAYLEGCGVPLEK